MKISWLIALAVPFLGWMANLMAADDDCRPRKPLHCQSAVVVKMESSQTTGNCQGVVRVGGADQPVALLGVANCPAEGGNILGNLLPYCPPDKTTSVRANFRVVTEESCKFNYRQRTEEVQRRAKKLRDNMTEAQVQEIFPEVDGERGNDREIVIYYEHPNVLVEVQYRRDANNIRRLAAPPRLYQGRPGLRGQN